MSYGVGCRCTSDLELWLWCRPLALALIRPLAWELPCVTHVALKSKKEGRKKKKDVAFSRCLLQGPVQCSEHDLSFRTCSSLGTARTSPSWPVLHTNCTCRCLLMISTGKKRNLKQPKYSILGKSLNKLCYIHPMQYYVII